MVNIKYLYPIMAQYKIRNKKIMSVTCARCTYTEFYKVKISALNNIFDLFTN